MISATGQDTANALRTRTAMLPMQPAVAPSEQEVSSAKDVQDAFGKFVGTTFYSQMLKSMRQTVGEPAYFHGGRGEEVFRSQLDQTLADQMSENGESRFSQAMFQQQFPREAEVLRLAAENQSGGADSLDALSALRRR